MSVWSKENVHRKKTRHCLSSIEEFNNIFFTNVNCHFNLYPTTNVAKIHKSGGGHLTNNVPVVHFTNPGVMEGCWGNLGLIHATGIEQSINHYTTLAKCLPGQDLNNDVKLFDAKILHHHIHSSTTRCMNNFSQNFQVNDT